MINCLDAIVARSHSPGRHESVRTCDSCKSAPGDPPFEGRNYSHCRTDLFTGDWPTRRETKEWTSHLRRNVFRKLSPHELNRRHGIAPVFDPPRCRSPSAWRSPPRRVPRRVKKRSIACSAPRFGQAWSLNKGQRVHVPSEQRFHRVELSIVHVSRCLHLPLAGLQQQRANYHSLPPGRTRCMAKCLPRIVRRLPRRNPNDRCRAQRFDDNQRRGRHRVARCIWVGCHGARTR